MELDSLKMQLRELRGYYDDDTKSDDDIIYLVYDWVKSAHAVAQLLLLEGRFPELRRCLDLCRQVLQEEYRDYNNGNLSADTVSTNGGSSNGGWRRVVSRATGEDRLLMDSLLVRTSQLQKQYEEARLKTKGRDTQYYMNKLLRPTATNNNKEEEGNVGGDNLWERAPPSPPERGVSFGRRTRLNRWKVPPLLPPLVTQSRPFFRRVVAVTDALVGLRSRGDADSSRTTTTSVSPSSSSGKLSLLEIEANEDLAPYYDSQAAERTLPPSPLLLAAEAELKREKDSHEVPTQHFEAGFEPTAPLPHLPHTLCTASSKLPRTQRTIGKIKEFIAGHPLRCLSAGLHTSRLSSGEVEYRPPSNMDVHLIKSAIAIKSANMAQKQSIAMMNALSESATSFLQLQERQQQQHDPVEQSSLRRAINGASSDGRGIEKKQDKDIISSGNWHLVGIQPNSSASYPTTTPEEASILKPIQRHPSSSSHVRRTLEPQEHYVSIELDAPRQKNMTLKNEQGPPFVSTKKESFRVKEIYPHLSEAGREELEEIYKSYKEENSQLRASLQAMRRKAKDQSDIFKSNELVVRVEDLSVWKARRRNPAAASERSVTMASSTSDFFIGSPNIALSPKSVSKVGASHTTGMMKGSTIPSTISSGGNPLYGSSIGGGVGGVQSAEGTAKFTDHDDLHSNGRGLDDALPNKQVDVHLFGSDSRAMERNMVTPDAGETTFDDLSSALICALPKYIGVRGSIAERRLTRLRSSTHVAFPDIHDIVMRRTVDFVEQEERRKSSCTMPPPLPSSQSTVAPLTSPPEAIRDLLDHQKGAGNDSLKSAAGEITKKDKEEKEVFLVKLDKENRMDRFVASVSLEKLHCHANWLLVDPITLGMCFPLHLATVTIQCMCRRFLARCERERRAIAVEEYLRQMIQDDRDVTTAQRYARRWLAHRLVSTMILRLAYQIDQRVEYELNSVNSGLENKRVSVSYNTLRLQRRHTSHTTSIVSLKEHTHFTQRRESMGSIGHPQYRDGGGVRASILSHSCGLYEVPLINYFPRPSVRRAGLKRIQENIASRVIVRAFRTYCNKVFKRIERETHNYMKYVTGRLDFMEYIGLSRGSPKRYGNVACQLVDPNERSGSYSLSRSGSALQGVYPIAPERLLGDVVGTWELRAAEARRRGDFMTPLEGVKLSELQGILRQRQEAEEAQCLSEEMRLQKEEELQQQQHRMEMNALLLIQRSGRGYMLRNWLFIQCHIVHGEPAIQRRRVELLDGRSSISFSPHITSSAGNFFLSFATKNDLIRSEADPIPSRVDAMIRESIHRRHPMWFGFDEEARRKGIKAVTLIQSYLRYHNSLKYLADRYIDICAITIQRRWRRVLKQRKELEKRKTKNMIATLRVLGS